MTQEHELWRKIAECNMLEQELKQREHDVQMMVAEWKARLQSKRVSLEWAWCEVK